MSGGHGHSRRRAYGRRQKALRDRHSTDLNVDLEGPADWPRGNAWEGTSPATSGQWQVSDRRNHRPLPGSAG
jgi:hypothetical protein